MLPEGGGGGGGDRIDAGGTQRRGVEPVAIAADHNGAALAKEFNVVECFCGLVDSEVSSALSHSKNWRQRVGCFLSSFVKW